MDLGQAPASSKTASLAVAGVAMAALAAGGRKAAQPEGFGYLSCSCILNIFIHICKSIDITNIYIYIYL